MAADLESILLTVRAVMTGRDASGNKVTRNDLPRFGGRELAHVAFAIMLARPDTYLVRTEVDKPRLRNYLNATLQEIIFDGLVHNRISRRKLVEFCRRAELYNPEPGRGSNKRIWLTPPPALKALVAELGNHPGVEAFCEAIEEGKRIQCLPPPWRVTGKNGSPSDKADRVVAWLRGLEPPIYEQVVKKLQN